MSDLMDRIAGAPISWGVDGSPDWGHLMDRDRVLAEMVDIGLSATELGPDGYLGDDPQEVVDRVGRFGLSVVGGFVPVVLYRHDLWEGEAALAARAADTLAACGSEVLVLGPAAAHAGYDDSVDLDEVQWTEFEANLDRLLETCRERGLRVAIHQHWGMAIERLHHLERVLEQTTIDLCLDTGHLFLAGVDPVDLAKRWADRIAHVHLKDVDVAAAEQVRSGAARFRSAVISGLFRPLGSGGVDVAGVVEALEDRGYQGWYVLEQDTALESEPEVGSGPIDSAAQSFEFLQGLVAA